MAPLSRQPSTSDVLCGTERELLKLIDSPFVYSTDGMWMEERNKDQSYIACPLEGGYVVTGWQDATGQRKIQCLLVPMMKVENECERREGLRISFPRVNSDERNLCSVPFKYKWQVYCLAHWEEGPWTFMVVRDDYDVTIQGVCMRYTTDTKSDFTLDIFMDSTCYTSNNYANNYRLNLMKYPARSPCDNWYPYCDTPQDPLNECKHFQAAQYCPRFCSSCDGNKDIFAEKEAVFPSQLIGSWLKDNIFLPREMVVITSKDIEIPSLGKYKLLGEANCWTSKYIANTRATEYIFLMTF